MGRRKVAISSVLLSLFLFVSLRGVVFAFSGNWVEVTRFTGKVDVERLTGRELNVDITTENFTCNYVEWRIRWNFSPSYVYRGNGEGRYGIFSIIVYQGDNDIQVGSIGGSGTEAKNGTWVHNENGTFHLRIRTLFAYEYSIIVEQNIDSIPEFPSWIILPLFLIATVIDIIHRNKLRRKIR